MSNIKSKASRKKNTRETVARSITFSIDVANNIDKISELPQYRKNRSMAVESLITTNPVYVKLIKNKK